MLSGCIRTIPIFLSLVFIFNYYVSHPFLELGYEIETPRVLGNVLATESESVSLYIGTRLGQSEPNQNILPSSISGNIQNSFFPMDIILIRTPLKSKGDVTLASPGYCLTCRSIPAVFLEVEGEQPPIR